MTTYRIRNWNKYYENNRTRELKRLDWVPIPNKQGCGYLELLDHPNGPAHFGAWVAILEIASRCATRGTLTKESAIIPQDGAEIPQACATTCGVAAMDMQDLARMSRMPVTLFREAIPRLINLGWIECLENQRVKGTPQASAEIPQRPAEKPALNRIEENGREENTHTSSKLPTEEQPVENLPAVAEKPGVCVSEKKEPGRLGLKTSERFQEFLALWPACANRDRACRMWVSRVTLANEAAVFECLDRYRHSDQWARGVIMDQSKWLTVQADSNWSGTWVSDTTQLDPIIQILKDIERKMKEEDRADQRNGSANGNHAHARLERISETSRRSGISARINGKLP